MAVLNSTILEKAWLSGTNDYQQRIPNPAISSYAEHVAALFDPMNNDLYNQFSGMLVGLMGTYVESKLFENPLRALKKPAAQWGNTERRVAVKYLQAHSYKVDDETLLKLEKPDFVEWFYSVGKPRRYEFSWSKYEMQRVFAADGYGYDDLLAATISQMYSSDNYDEMNIMIQMFAEADQRMGGLYRYNLSAAPTTEATGKELLTGIRAVAGRMKFPTRLYNHIPVPVFETGDTLILWVTPETQANLDVNTLASVFQLDKADIQYRIITIPEFPLPNVYAALTSEDFVYARDVYYGIEPPFYNPANMTSKYYLQHSEMIGFNPAANCVLFTTDAATTVPTITQTITDIELSIKQTSQSEMPAWFPVGGVSNYPIQVSLVGNTSNDNFPIEPNAAMFSIVSVVRNMGEKTEAVPFNAAKTYVDNRGFVHIGDDLQGGDVITIQGTSVYINPSGTTKTFTATLAITARLNQRNKECDIEHYPFICYIDMTMETTASE